MKIFYLINETYEGSQVGYRAALNSLKDKGIIADYLAFSFYNDVKKTKSWERTLENILIQAQDYSPNVVLVAHLLPRHVITKGFYEKLKASIARPSIFIYDERDVFGYFSKPIKKNVLNFAKYSDFTCLVTYGKMAQRFRNYGCKNVLYLPHVADTANFGKEWSPTNERKYDIIMIANRARSKVPFKSMPGIKDREELVKKLYSKFGDRFAIFGYGWEGFKGNKGRIDFNQQEIILRDSWLSIGQDHFPSYDGYYSDRLPIALLSGVAHITRYIPGLENLFINKEHLLYFESTKQAVEICEDMLSWPKKDLIALGQRGKERVLSSFTEEHRMLKIVNYAKKVLANKCK